jgi:DNA polymerase-1
MINANCPKCPGCQIEPWGNEKNPHLAFVGDPPDEREVRQGRAFGGKEGKLLRTTLTEIGFDTSKVYYNNALLFNPAKKGSSKKYKPKMTELRLCNPRLIKQLEEVSPRMIVPLGAIGSMVILGDKVSSRKRRGIYREVLLGGSEIGVMPTISLKDVFSKPDDYVDFYRDLEKIHRILYEGETPIVRIDTSKYIIIDTQSKFDALIRRLKEKDRFALDLETTAKKPWDGEILSCSFTWQEGTAAILDWVKMIKNGPVVNKASLESVLYFSTIMHNSQFDAMWLTHNGFPILQVQDTMLENYALDERKGIHSLKRLSADRYNAPPYDDDLKGFLKERRKLREFNLKDEIESEEEENEVDPASPVSKGSDGSNEDNKGGLRLYMSDWEDPESRRSIMMYNGMDSDYTFRLDRDLSEEMISDGVDKFHDIILSPAALHFKDLELEGMLVDREYHESLAKKWSKERQESEVLLRSHPGAGDMNFGSYKQLSSYIYDTLQLDQMKAADGEKLQQDEILEEIQAIEDEEAQEYWHAAPNTQYKNMSPRSTNTYMLYWLSQQHEFPRQMVKWRLSSSKYTKFYTTIRKMMTGDRFHPQYRVNGTRTGRFSSSGFNVHGTSRLKEIKNIFMADPGFILIGADYRQAEVRMLAHMSKDDALIEAMRSTDIHEFIACLLFGLSLDQMKALKESDSERAKLMRRAAKTIVFGLIYGRSIKSIATQMGMSEMETEARMQILFKMMPKAKVYIENQKRVVRIRHEVVSLYGNKRRFPILLDKRHMSHAEREGVNMPIQGSVSCMTFLANYDILNQLREEGIEVRRWPHIHDGFLFQVEEGFKNIAIESTKDRMHNVGFDTDVHFATEISVGYKWGDIEKVYEG